VHEGDVVFTLGSHASHVRIDTARQLCLAVPEDLAPEVAVFARLVTVPLATVRTARARAGDPAAVIGLGVVGNLAAQVLQAAGMPTLAVERLPARRELAVRSGVRVVVDPADTDRLRPEHALVLEATGTADGAVAALDLARLGGEVSLVGTPWVADPSVPASDVLRAVHLRYLTLRSGWEWQLPLDDVAGQADAVHQPGSVTHSTTYAFDLLRSGKVRVDDLVTHRATPDLCQQVYARAIDNKDVQLGAIFDWR
jgi:threonine dehydrogenase-like Zn-dependent dehydrogenase